MLSNHGLQKQKKATKPTHFLATPTSHAGAIGLGHHTASTILISLQATAEEAWRRVTRLRGTNGRRVLKESRRRTGKG